MLIVLGWDLSRPRLSTHQTQYAYYDQIYAHDPRQQAGRNKDQDAGYQSHHRLELQIYSHFLPPMTTETTPDTYLTRVLRVSSSRNAVKPKIVTEVRKGFPHFLWITWV